jgi:drug/metabolite transporter (DMT)-like permease
MVVSCLLLGAVALVRRDALPARRDLLAIAVYGVLFLGVYSTTLNAAERRVDAGTAAMLINTGPLLIAIFAGIFLREGYPSGLFAGCAVAFAGCVLIGLSTGGSGTDARLGVVLCVVAALAYAAAVVVQKHVLARVSPFQVTWLGCSAAAIALLPFAPRLVTDTENAPASAIGWIVYLGAVPIALGFITWTFALRRMSAGRAASLNYLIPVVAIALGWAVLSERPPWLALAGGALCIAGVYLARRGTFRLPRRSATSRARSSPRTRSRTR